MKEREAKLLTLTSKSPRCADLDLTMKPAKPFGLEVVRKGQSMGIWSERDSVLAFRNLADWQTRRTAGTAAEAMELTITMAEQNSWLD